MFHSFKLLAIGALIGLAAACQSNGNNPPITQEVAQAPLVVGGPCEGCEAALEAPGQLNYVDTTVDFNVGAERLLLTGICRDSAGNPVPNVIVYIHHTDSTGRYRSATGAQGWAGRHGQLRSWLRTNEAGKYALYTTMPASYPSSNLEAHVHFYIKEACCTPYYIDDVTFAGDTLPDVQTLEDARGGSGLSIPDWNDSLQLLVVHRDIWLGKNIPNHPWN